MDVYSQLIAGPASEPVTLTEAKMHLRLAVDAAGAEAYTNEDSRINVIISTARQMVEAYSRRQLINQTWNVYLDRFPSCVNIILPLSPVSDVASIAYTDANGDAATFTDFAFDDYADRIRLNYGESWPTIYPQSDVIVQCTCGYGASADDVPESFKQAMLLIIGDLYRNTEESVIIGSGRTADIQRVPLGVSALLAPYRRLLL